MHGKPSWSSCELQPPKRRMQDGARSGLSPLGPIQRRLRQLQ